MNTAVTQPKKSDSAAAYMLKFILFSILLALAAIIIKTASAHLSAGGISGASAAVPDNSLPLIIIDAGHGGEDGGAVGGGLREKDVTLSIAQKISDMLKINAIPVIMTRSEDIMLYDRNVDYKGRKKMLDLKTRLDIANKHENSIFVSIHMNAFPEEKYSGLQVYYSRNDHGSQVLADKIQSFARQYTQPENDRKTKPATSAIFLLHKIQTPAVLVECGFLTNYAEARNFAGDQHRQKIAAAIFCAILEYIHSNDRADY